VSPRPRADRPGLDRASILDRALALLDAEGLEAFSMRGLGRALGVDPMAVYYYFPNQGALFDGVVERIYEGAGLPEGTPPSEPAARLKGAVGRLRQAFLAHPAALALVATRPAATADVWARAEAWLGLLAEAGVPVDRRLDTITCLTVFTIGHALAQAGAPVGGPSALPAPEPDPAALPLFTEAWAAAQPYDPDRQFSRGLQALVSGLLVQVAE